MKEHPSLDRLQQWLDSYLNFERLPQKDIFWLDTMEFLCRKLGNPQDTFPSVHVAGSKGKGSTSVMIASILEAAGYPTGLYTSPHILSFAERVASAKGPLPEEVYLAASTRLMEAVSSIPARDLPGQRPITWFELVTTFAFICFQEAHVDWAVFETGLGGRLDATNVIMPKISVITPIELEHTEFLGNTIEKIAAEKAGIIKEGVPVVLGLQQEAAKLVLEARAKELQSPIISLEKVISASGRIVQGKMEVRLESPLFSQPLTTRLSLLGDYQLWNAATAAVTVKTLLPDLTEEAIEKGLAQAFLPGRFEVVEYHQQIIILDGAHTPNSVRSTLSTLKRYLEECGLSAKEPQLLFACAADKDVETMAALFSGFGRITLTRPGGEKQSSLELVQEAFQKAGHTFTCYQDYQQAIIQALEEARRQDAILLVTGSFYLVAEVKKMLEKRAAG
ncbi:MAG: bifunctional folylpolyglutamate synthase/dihydrofolate synthase [Spirochaetaceae bacterium]|nr:bifunctional folylpolyglutamate synthase/dihydrofolate synthase [Spirochaetaceae bacterium]